MPLASATRYSADARAGAAVTLVAPPALGVESVAKISGEGSALRSATAIIKCRVALRSSSKIKIGIVNH